MKSNLFGKLSAGVAGVALMAIGVGSTPVQAAILQVGFSDRSILAGTSVRSNYLHFDGSFLFNTDANNNAPEQITNWSLSIYGSNQQNVFVPKTYVPSKVTSSSYNEATLTLMVNAKITSNEFATEYFPGINVTAPEQLFFTLEKIRKDGQRVIDPPSPWQVPYVDTLPGGSSQVLQANDTKKHWDRLTYTSVPEPSTYFGTILAFGALGAVKVLKRQQKNKETFTP